MPFVRSLLELSISWLECHAAGRGESLPGPMIDQRIEDVHRIYTSTDLNETMQLLRRYGVQYVYVGQSEKIYYGERGSEQDGHFVPPSMASVCIGNAFKTKQIRRIPLRQALSLTRGPRRTMMKSKASGRWYSQV